MDAKKHWAHQRFSAAMLALASVWFFLSLISLRGSSYHDIQMWAKAPLSFTCLMVLNITLFYYGYLGLHVILQDYIPHKEWRRFFNIILAFCALLFGSFGVLSLLALL